MPSGNRDLILRALRISGGDLDDDELSRLTGVQPRQAVSQLCRRLDAEGVLERIQSPGGKVVNRLVRIEQPVEPADEVDEDTLSIPAPYGVEEVRPAPATARPPGSSAEQRGAERVMLDLLGRELGLTLAPTVIRLATGEKVEVDGADEGHTVLVECWAHQGPPKPAQKAKVVTDAFKLSWVGTALHPGARKILCLSDPAAAASFLPHARSWQARAFQDLGIEVWVVTLPTSVRARILAAQRRQFR